MYKVEPNIKKMMDLSEQTNEDLKERHRYLMEELKYARNAFEFERTSEIKMEMVYIIEEFRKRKAEEAQEDNDSK